MPCNPPCMECDFALLPAAGQGLATIVHCGTAQWLMCCEHPDDWSLTCCEVLSHKDLMLCRKLSGSLLPCAVDSV